MIVFWKMLVVLSMVGGCVSVIGDWLIRIALSLLIPLSSADFSEVLVFDFSWTAVAFISGFISVACWATSFIRTIQLTAAPGVIWTKYGVLYGILVGLCNVLILASIHLSLIFGSGMSEGLAEAIEVIGLFFIYLPISVVIMGLPAAAIGVVAGIITEIVLRKFVFRDLPSRLA